MGRHQMPHRAIGGSGGALGAVDDGGYAHAPEINRAPPEWQGQPNPSARRLVQSRWAIGTTDGYLD